MKKIVTLVLFAFLVGSVSAQTLYESVRIANRDLTGSARFVGMGGAMGALGGDISTIGVNPAGIGIYRSNDFMGTISYSMNETKSKYDGQSFTADKNRFTFDNIGAVFSTKIGNQTTLRYVNFGINYQRTKSFYKNMSMGGLTRSLEVSQVTQMVNQANDGWDAALYEGRDIPDLGEEYPPRSAYENGYVGWLSAHGFNGLLMGEDENGYYSRILDAPDMLFDSQERGGIDRYDFNVSFNFNDRFYLGLTFGAYDVNYKKSVIYDEDYGNGEGYNLASWNNIEGAGFDVKLGMIIRPFEFSPFRLGLAVHTPRFFNLSQYTTSDLQFDMVNDNDQLISGGINTWDERGGYDARRDFKLQTPWMFNVSMGYTFGTELAIGAEYEYEDYSSMKLKYRGGWSGTMPETDAIKNMVKGVSTFRIGAEYKVVPEFALRLGYNYSTAAFYGDSWKPLPYNSVNTDTDFANTKGVSNYTLGFGYRGQIFYADLAYKYNNYKEDFYAFEHVDLAATKVTNNNHQISLTLGMRF